MKLLLIFLISTGFIFSCSKKDDKKIESNILGKWGLVEVLADPGDGSGRFHSVTSNKFLEFHDDGTVSSNGIICDMSIDANTASTETYSLQDSTISSTTCPGSPFKINFSIQGSNLIIYYPCIEGCRAKYIRK